MIIAPLEPSDYPDAAEVYRNSRRFLVDITGEAPESLGLPLVVREEAEAKEHGATCFGIRLRETHQMVGAAVYQPSGYGGDPACAWIALLMFSEHHQQRGYGAEAYRVVEDAIFAQPGVNAIKLAVLVNNPAGLCFWEKMGYTKLTTRKHIQGGPDVTIMEKRR